jgi:hypothetical protein
MSTPELQYTKWLQQQQENITADQAAYDPEYYRRIQRRREKRLIHAMRNGLPAKEEDPSAIDASDLTSAQGGMSHHITRDVENDHEYNLSLYMARDEDVQFAKQLERDERKKMRLESVREQLRLRGVEASTLAKMRLDAHGVVHFEGNPPLANYGHANTSPVYGGFVYGNYMASHNGMCMCMCVCVYVRVIHLYISSYMCAVICPHSLSLSQCTRRCRPTSPNSPTHRHTDMRGVRRCRMAYTRHKTCH